MHMISTQWSLLMRHRLHGRSVGEFYRGGHSHARPWRLRTHPMSVIFNVRQHASWLGMAKVRKRPTHE